MCGRFVLYTDLERLLQRFMIDFSSIQQLQPRYNIAPGQPVLALIHDGKQSRLGHLKWGLIPFWNKDPKPKHTPINARVETLTEKPSFKHLLNKKRCLILADGFYEWQRTSTGTKQPYYIYRGGKEPFAMAGLWDSWRDHEGSYYYTCTIITTEAHPDLKHLHDRMPVIMKAGSEQDWINPHSPSHEEVLHILEAQGQAQLSLFPVSNEVNTFRSDGEQLIQPIIN
jgi:putative SOS response-associated peptidase YedK